MSVGGITAPTVSSRIEAIPARLQVSGLLVASPGDIFRVDVLFQAVRFFADVFDLVDSTVPPL
jgi:hypothetical protein